MDTANNNGNIAAAIEAGRKSVVVEDRIYSYEAPNGVSIPLGLVDAQQKLGVLSEAINEADRRAPAPRRITGRVVMTEVASFTDYLNRFKTSSSSVYAAVEDFRLTGVINHAEADAPAWQDHRVVYDCPRSPEWELWTAKSGHTFSQEDFAQWIEDRFDDLASTGEDDMPAPLEVMQMARSLQVYIKGRFESDIDKVTGLKSLVCKEEMESSSTRIHPKFRLKLRVFDGGEYYAVTANVRFRVRDGRASFAYELHRHKEIERDAFGDVRKAVAAATELPVYAGTPA